MATKNAESIYEYNPRFAECRDLRHSWDIEEWVGGKRVLVCWCCDTRRLDEIDGHGIVGRRYVYPRGYNLKHVKFPILEVRKRLAAEAQKLDRWVGLKKNHKSLLQPPQLKAVK